MEIQKKEDHPALIGARKRYKKSKEIALSLAGYKYTDAIEILNNTKAHLLELAEIVPRSIESF